MTANNRGDFSMCNKVDPCLGVISEVVLPLEKYVAIIGNTKAFKDTIKSVSLTMGFKAMLARLANKIVRAAPQNYLRFGPYWWVLKAALIARGYAYTGELEPLIAGTYCGLNEKGELDADITIVAAFEFAEMHDAAQFQGVRQFDLFGDGEFYVLMDESVEMAPL
ncbi:hypothetical protein [Collimonas silvisoli]|uniref:hypothetical protein n=1 Tax=Collimonas silvisoli TaxID=2825884 RepID=UPI001B8DA2C8|nr:hypothetical protein [Collimonas silvisoli]